MYLWNFDPHLTNLDDWTKKYHGTIVKYNDKLAKVNVDHELTTFNFGGKSSLVVPHGELEQPPKIEPWFPESSWIHMNTLYKSGDKGGTLFLRRIPARQWKKSACSDCYRLYSPLFDKLSTTNNDFLMKDASSVTYFDLDDAVEQLRKSTTLGFPLSKYFAVHRFDNNLFGLYSPEALVGLIDANKKVIRCSSYVVKSLMTFVTEQWTIKESSLF